MHYAAVSVIEPHGPEDVRREIAAGRHLSTLAFSERGSRSHFWAPVSTATAVDDGVRLDAAKSWVTSAGEADSYVWSSRPVSAEGPMTLWLVPGATPGRRGRGRVRRVRPARQRLVARWPPTARSSPPRRGSATTAPGSTSRSGTALPTFLVGNAAVSLGLMEALVDEAAGHLTSTRLEHLDQSLAEQAPTRLAFAALRTRVDTTRAFLADTLAALGSGRADATLRVLQVKAVAAEAAAEVADGVMRLCGGAAFRKELGIERRYRDALAARVMAPTTEALHDFVGRATLGLPLFGGA